MRFFRPAFISQRNEQREGSAVKWAVEAASEYVIECDCSLSELWFICMVLVMLTVYVQRVWERKCVCVWMCLCTCLSGLVEHMNTQPLSPLPGWVMGYVTCSLSLILPLPFFLSLSLSLSLCLYQAHKPPALLLDLAFNKAPESHELWIDARGSIALK